MLSVSLASLADDPGNENDEGAFELEPIQVTGTRIRRIDAEGALPVTIINRETIDLSGETSLADFVRSLSFNIHGSYRSQFGGTEQGTTQINLRGLGPGRSLVLLDGRRHVKAPVSTISQDLNTIPMGAVERIEILSDGASAIYGSDAIAGVINIITRDDYEGWELMYGLGRTDSGGGDRDNGSIMFGTSGEQWRLLATFSWNRRDVTNNRDFDWFEPDLDIFANNFSLVDPETGFDFQNWTAIPDGCSDSEAFSLVPYPPSLSGEACIYDYNLTAADETSVDTGGLMVKFEYNLSTQWSIWANALVSETEAYGRSAPAESWFHSPIPPDSPNNPTNPASAFHDPAFGPNVPVNYWHRFAGLDPFQATVNTDLQDVQLGMTGWLGRAELDFGMRFTRSSTEDLSENAINADIAHSFVVDGTYDLQHPLGNAGGVLDAMRETLNLWWDFDQDQAFATASWDWLEIGGIPIQWIFGGEYREEAWNWDSTFLPPANSERDVLAFYFEALLPLTRKFELSLAGRYDDYSDWGDNFAPKVSARWRALDQLAFRASWGEGFRAPELTIGAEQTSEGVGWTNIDPQSCEVYEQPPGCWVPFLHVDTVSPALGPEQSEQYSIGLVWEPSVWFNLTIDYYNIQIEDKIQWMWPDLILVREQLDAPNPPGFESVRDPNSGALVSITSGWGNFGYVETSGMDLTLNVDFGLGPGRWSSNFLGSYGFEDVYDGYDFAGRSGVPQSRATLSNRYDISDFTLVWNIHYIGSQDGDVPGYSEGRVPTWMTHDLQLNWRAPWNGDLALGAQNAFNETPELDVGPIHGNRYNTQLYDAFGRILYARYTQRF